MLWCAGARVRRVGGGEAGGLAFSGKVAAVEHICMAQHLAQLHEVGLRALALIQVVGRAARALFGDELLGSHGGWV